jgi:hypothetical protein
MPAEASELARIREARRIVERMWDRLLHPTFESVEDSAADLSQAAECIRRLDTTSPAWQGKQRQALEAEVIGLRRAIGSVQALLVNAGKFYAGWARLLASDQAPPNYDSAGSVRLIPAEAGKLVIHG